MENCTGCNKCVNECLFLKKYGNPLKIKEKINKNLLIAFECSICRLCENICENNVKFVDFILSKREEAAENKLIPFSKLNKILKFEKLASSNLFKIFNIPDKSRKVFFPGCVASGNSPDLVLSILNKLKENINEPIGLVVDCCFKISHDLGFKIFFMEKLKDKIKIFKENHIEEIITVCPSCTDIFNRYLPIKVNTVYEYLQNEQVNIGIENVHVHDSCALRNDIKTQEIIRKILKNSNTEIIPFSHEKAKTFCCGEGGGVRFVDKNYSKNWKKKRLKEVKHPVIVYCYGCKLLLKNRNFPVIHILDLIFKKKGEIGWITLWLNKILLKFKVILRRKI